MANTSTDSWDVASPADTEFVSEGADELRYLRGSVGERLSKEHNTIETGDVSAGAGGGEHKAGSAKVYVGDYSAAWPTTRPDGNALTSDDYGRLAFDTGSTPDRLAVYLSGGWTLITDSMIATLLAATRTFAEIITFSKSPVFTLGIVGNNAYITARNAVGDGNSNMIKVNDSNVPCLGANAVLDTSMGSADLSIASRAFVLASVAAVGSLIGEGAARVVTTIYEAETDGILVVLANGQNDTIVYSDSDPTPDTIVGRVKDDGAGSSGNISTLTVPIKNGNYYQITATTSITGATFYPLGA